MDQVLKAIDEARREIDIALKALRDDRPTDFAYVTNAITALENARKALSVIVWTS